jgi:hypothetical protein
MCDPLVIGFNFIENIFFTLALVAGILTLIFSVSYMLGSIFKEEKYKLFAKKEAYNLFLSLLLLILFFPIVTVVESVTCTSHNVSMYDFTINNMENVLYGEIYPIISSLYKISIFQTSVSHLKLSFGAGTFKPLGFLGDVSKSLNVVSFIMEISFSSIYIQALALSFFKVTAFNIFFPLGILFRGIPLLRNYGSFVIAFSIALSTIYPFIYFISFDAYYGVFSSMNFKDNVNDLFYPKGIFSRIAVGLDNTMFWFLTFAEYNSLRDMFFTFGRVLFLAVGIPAFAIILTFACASSINKFLNRLSA